MDVMRRATRALAGLALALCALMTPWEVAKVAAQAGTQAQPQGQAGTQGACRFVLGFEALHDAIPAVVGDCLEDEHPNPENGNTEQHTTRGLLVWRKADNWTAFTDGGTTWINGPRGVVSRPNRGPFFPWEAGAGQAVERCHTSQLAAGVVGAEGAAGSTYATLQLVNHSNTPCQIYGYVGALMLDAQGHPLPTVVQRVPGFGATPAGPVPFVLNPHTAGSFVMRLGNVPVGDEQECPQAFYLLITPPDETEPLLLTLERLRMAPCNHGHIDVSPVLPPAVSPA
jgi:hypothetical protein